LHASSVSKSITDKAFQQIFSVNDDYPFQNTEVTGIIKKSWIKSISTLGPTAFKFLFVQLVGVKHVSILISLSIFYNSDPIALELSRQL